MAFNFFKKVKDGLTKTREAIADQISDVFGSKYILDEEACEELEMILISSDMGMTATTKIIDTLKKRIKTEKVSKDDINRVLKEEIAKVFVSTDSTLKKASKPPTVLLMVGVNGTGKTTTSAKLASHLMEEGNKVLLGACDTFRAAAADQLEMWGNRIKCEVIRHVEGADPAAVAFDSYKASVSRKADYLILDTAGRLHNKVNLMEELKKIGRVISKESPDAPNEVLLVLDATTGQNAIAQAKAFKEIIGVTGIVLTKLDGTAKGGIVVAIASEMQVPVKFIGLGEGVDDLKPFDAKDFVDALIS